MPWCDGCSRFYNPNTLPEDGHCPECGRALVRPGKLRRLQEGKGSGADALAARSALRAAPGETDPGPHPGDPGADDDDHTPIPWHFWLLVAALVIYLGWRLVQLALWLAK